MSIIEDFMNSISQAVGSDLGRAASSPNPETAIPAKILQNPGQFAQNALGDAGNLIKGTLAIPGNVIKSVSQGTEGQDLQNLGSNIANTYKGIAQDPYGSFIKNPISTSMAIAPAGNIVSGVSDAVTGADAGAATDASAATPEATGETPSPQNPATTVKPPVSKMITADQTPAPDDAVANYNSIFQVPRNIVQNMKIKPDAIINQLIDDGVTNVSNLDDLSKIADNVTGETGAFPAINRTILSDIKNPIDITEARNAAGLNQDIPSSIDTYLEGSPKGLITTVTNQIQRALPQPDPLSALPEGTAMPSDIFDSSQELDRLSNMYKRKAYTAMGDLTNPEYERAAQAIQDVSNNMKDSLDTSITPEQYQAYKTDPRVLQQLQRVPAPMAQRWLDNAKEFRDGRSIQAPYVGLKNMVEDTKDAQLSAFTKWTNAMQKNQASQGVAEAITHPVKAMQGAAQEGLAKVISPLTDKTPEDLFRSKTSGASATVTPSKLGFTAPLVQGIKAGASALPIIAKSEEPQNENNTGEQNPANINQPQVNQNGQHGGIISQQGRYTMPQTPDGYLLGNDHDSKQQALTQAVAQDKATNNTVKEAQDQGQLDQLNNKWNNQTPIREQYTKTNTITGLGNAAANLINKVPLTVLNLNGSYDSLLNSTNPQYQALGRALQDIENKTGVKLSTAKSKDALIAGLDYALSSTHNDLNAQFAQFFGGNALNASPNATKTSLPPIAPIQSSSTELPAITASQAFGGSLPPIQ